MATNDVYRITAQFSSSSGDIFQWVWNYLQTSGGDEPPQDIADAVATVLTAVWALLDEHIHTSISGDTLEVAKSVGGSAPFDTVATADISSLVGATGLTGPANFQDAPVLKFFTSVGRSIGKKFLFGIVTGSFVGQSPSGALLADMILAGIAWAAGPTVNGSNFVPGNHNVKANTFRQFTGVLEANLLTGSQDRRRRGIGL